MSPVKRFDLHTGTIVNAQGVPGLFRLLEQPNQSLLITAYIIVTLLGEFLREDLCHSDVEVSAAEIPLRFLTKDLAFVLPETCKGYRTVRMADVDQ